MYAEQGIKVALFDRVIDTQFASMLEQYMGGVKFIRIDADIADTLKSDDAAIEFEAVKALFEESLGERTSVKFEALKDASIPVILNVSEESRRMEDLMRMYGMNDSGYAGENTLVINSSSPLIQKLDTIAKEDSEKAKEISDYLYKLSLLSQKKFDADEMQDFMKASVKIMMML